MEDKPTSCNPAVVDIFTLRQVCKYPYLLTKTSKTSDTTY